MRVDDLREFYTARPFRPFHVRTTEGREVLVKHPELMLITPSGRTVVIAEPDQGLNIIDIMLINSVFVSEPRTRPSRNGHKKKRPKR